MVGMEKSFVKKVVKTSTIEKTPKILVKVPEPKKPEPKDKKYGPDR